MPLDSLAPDQRAVVQLVLQQGRSYGDLAGLLGISEDAVRERAQAGLAELGGGPAPAGASDVADFLLGQQTVSQRAATRDMLASDAELGAWAHGVAANLHDVSDDIPELPSAAAATPAPTPADADLFEEEPAALDEPATAVAPLDRPRPRPRPVRDRDKSSSRRRETYTPRSPGDEDDRPPASRLGGALLIGGLAILVAAILIFVVNGGEDDDPASNGTTATEASPTPEATATPQALGQIALDAVEGQTGRGVMALFVQPDSGLVFTLAAERVPALEEGEAYAMWFTRADGDAQLLGFFQEAPQGDNRQLTTSGPRDEDSARFARWITRYDNIVVSKETVNRPQAPNEIVLQGELPEAQG